MSNRGAVLQGASIGEPVNFDAFQRNEQLELQRKQMKLDEKRYAQSEAERKGREDELRAYKNQAFLGGATETKDIKTGPEKIRSFTVGKLREIEKKYSSKTADLPINVLAEQVFSEVNPVLAGYDVVMKKTAEEDAKINAAIAGNKNLNKEAIMNDVYKNIANDYLTEDKDGQLTYNAIDKVDPTKDYTGSLLAAPDYHKYAMGTAPLTTYMNAVKGVPANVFVANPKGGRTKWSGSMTDFQKLNAEPDEFGTVKGQPGLEFITEKVNGVDVLPEDLFKTHIYDSPEKKIAFDNSFDAFKKAHKLDFPDAESEDRARRKFALDEIVKPSIRNQMTPEIIKDPPRISISNRSGSGAGGVEINDIYQKIYSEVTRLTDYGEKKIPISLMDLDAQKTILDMVNAGKKADLQLPAEWLHIEKSDQGEILIKNKNGILVGSLSRSGTNLRVQPGVKEKREVIEQGENKSGKAPVKRANKDPLGLGL